MPEPDTVDLHDELLAAYQVTSDPEGLGPIFGGRLGRVMTKAGLVRRVPHSEAELIRGLRPAQLVTLVSITQDAARRCIRVFGRTGLNGGLADAFRHTYWSARLTQHFGAEWAARLTTAHERLPSADVVAMAMDLHNNEFGRGLGSAHPDATRDRLQDMVTAAVRDGKTVEIGPDGRLRRTSPHGDQGGDGPRGAPQPGGNADGDGLRGAPQAGGNADGDGPRADADGGLPPGVA
ncbi:hypothetical protein HH310_00240 [Actinoplanes sp. TBRC 11911]|uniref:DUF6973 domain-containing protein n=1 Tax=Actinoplanes sp. TBRC 11911 TaxID=2729386 RepID=UPI00145D0489|nr:hypothetical protein [Actinoplanes sp. TBRC 11911]NMO49633.1 hypothetical protein [Actinoplanes sp. TBRC 11911]